MPGGIERVCRTLAGGHPMTAFVAGATGLTGREVGAQLAAAGQEVVAHVRPDSSRLDEWTTRFTELGARVDSTPWDLSAMTGTLTELAPTHVYSLLGTTRKRAAADKAAGRASGYEAIDYGLSALLLKASVACGAAPRFVYLSSMGVKAGATGEYLQVRWRLEQELAAAGVPWTSARPSFIIGDRDEARSGEFIGATLGDGLLGLVGALGGKKLASRYKSIDGPGLAAALIRIAADPAAKNRIVERDGL